MSVLFVSFLLVGIIQECLAQSSGVAAKESTSLSIVDAEDDVAKPVVEKFLEALKTKQYGDASRLFAEGKLQDQWPGNDLEKLFEKCERSLAIERGVRHSDSKRIGVGPFQNYGPPKKTVYPNGGVLWTSTLRFKNAAMSIVFAIRPDGKIVGFEISPLPNEPALEHCGWGGGEEIIVRKGYNCTLNAECFDAEGKPFDPEKYTWNTMAFIFYRKIADKNEAGQHDRIWTDPADRTLWKQVHGLERHQNVHRPFSGEWNGNVFTTKMLPLGTFRVLLSAVKKSEETGALEVGSGNVLSRPIVFDQKNKTGNIRLQLLSGGSLCVDIVDADTGKPIEEAHASGLDFDHFPHEFKKGRYAEHAASDWDDNLVPGKYAFTVQWYDRHADDPVYEPEQEKYEAVIQAGQTTKAVVKMRKRPHTPKELDERWPFILTGTVKDTQGNPLPDAEVTIRRNDIFVSGYWPRTSTKTDHEGKYTLRFNPRAMQMLHETHPRKASPEEPDCMRIRVEVEKSGFVWKGIRDDKENIVGDFFDESDERCRVTNYSQHYCIDPEPSDLSKVEHEYGDSSHFPKPNEAVYRLKPYRVDVVMEPAVVLMGTVHFDEGILKTHAETTYHLNSQSVFLAPELKDDRKPGWTSCLYGNRIDEQQRFRIDVPPCGRRFRFEVPCPMSWGGEGMEIIAHTNYFPLPDAAGVYDASLRWEQKEKDGKIVRRVVLGAIRKDE